MSTNARPTPEPQPTTDPTTTATRDSAGDSADLSESWVALCQRQFSTDRTERLTNLVDEENQAMADGI